MIKRDNLQRMVMHSQPNGEGGTDITYDGLEFVAAYVSVTSVTNAIGPNEYGVAETSTINAVTDYYLDENKNIRYKWNNKLFELISQQKVGNEWSSVLKEVIN